MGLKLKDLKKSQRPRELALLNGFDTLDDIKLLAIILNTGVKEKDVLELSDELFSIYKNFQNMSKESLAGLKEIKGLSKTKALQIMAIFEVCRRYQKEKEKDIEKYNDSKKIYEKYSHLQSNEHETLILLFLDNNYHLIKERKISGNINEKIAIEPNEIIYELLISKAKKIVVIHTHLSNNVHPTDEDLIATEAIMRLSKQLEITLYDHIIIGEKCYYSFLENGFKNISK